MCDIRNIGSIFKQNKNILLGIIICVFLLGGSVFLYNRAIGVGAKALSENFENSFRLESDIAQEYIKDYAYDIAEKKYHASNKISICIGESREEKKLEVLDVSDVEYIIETAKNNHNNIDAWIEVPGKATFVVDLQGAEFLVDDVRKHVLVRVPYPEIANITIDYSNIRKLFYKDDIWNSSYIVGEELAKRQVDQAALLIRKEFLSNQTFFDNAKNSAKLTIINRVIKWNPNIDDLEVEVEFY